MGATSDHPFASSTVPRHLVRGLLGMSALVGSIALIPTIGVVSLLLLPLGALLLRGCPTCWAIGLGQTITAGRLRRECSSNGCAVGPRSD